LARIDEPQFQWALVDSAPFSLSKGFNLTDLVHVSVELISFEFVSEVLHPSIAVIGSDLVKVTAALIVSARLIETDALNFLNTPVKSGDFGWMYWHYMSSR
jgi:hypothetical protein